MIFGFAILSIPHLYFRRFFSSHPFGIQHAGENTFRRQRQRPQSRASTTVDCIGDRRRNAVDTDLADALGAERAGRVVRLHDDRIKLWRRFDEATTRLGTMAAGTNMLEVARAYEELAAIAGELAKAVLRADPTSGPRARARRSAP